MVALARLAASVPHELLDRIDTIAKAERRTRSQMALVLLEEALAAREGR